MSRTYRKKVKRYVWDTLTAAEQKNLFLICPVSDELARKQEPDQPVDKTVEEMSVKEFKAFHRAVLRVSRKRRGDNTPVEGDDETVEINEDAGEDSSKAGEYADAEDEEVKQEEVIEEEEQC